MGKTPTPLVIWVDDVWVNHPQIVELGNKGHMILSLEQAHATAWEEPNLILSKAAWNWDDDMFDEKGRNLETTLKAARKRKKGNKDG